MYRIEHHARPRRASSTASLCAQGRTRNKRKLIMRGTRLQLRGPAPTHACDGDTARCHAASDHDTSSAAVLYTSGETRVHCTVRSLSRVVSPHAEATYMCRLFQLQWRWRLRTQWRRATSEDLAWLAPLSVLRSTRQLKCAFIYSTQVVTGLISRSDQPQRRCGRAGHT